MTEKSLCNDLRKTVFADLGRVFKLADRISGEVPDFAVLCLGTTSWLEVKYARTPVWSSLTKAPNFQQQLLGMRLTAKHGHGAYCIFVRNRRALHLCVIHPEALAVALHDDDFLRRVAAESLPRITTTDALSTWAALGFVCVERTLVRPLLHLLLTQRCLRGYNPAKVSHFETHARARRQRSSSAQRR